MERKKYQADISKGQAIYKYLTKKGNELISRFTIFTDTKGLKIFTREGVVYLTEENCEVI